MTSSRELDIKHCIFRKTRAKGSGNGGALFLNTVGTVTINEANFMESSAGGNGGGIWISEGIAKITSSNFSRTTASKGGALAAGGGAQVDLTDTNILRSKSTSIKGGVLITLSCDAQVMPKTLL